ncbi:Macrolide export ATP-binding/permease protein MacB [Serratia plymuthica]|nr:Macrolide export ATP-binding/permease protein MacB [Serratia plymuthica]
MKLTSRRLAFVAAGALLAVLLIALTNYLQRPPQANHVTAPVRLGDIENAVLATGKMDAVERVNVGAQVSGQVKSLKVKLGDRVTQGQPIADIDDLPQRNDLRNAEAALNVAKADLQAKQALLKQAEFVDSVSPEVDTSDSIRLRSKSATASITGVGRDYFRVNGLTLLQGTTFRDDRNALQEVIIDENARNSLQEVIIDENARNSLFGDFGIEPLGQIVFLGAVPARVVGVVKSNQDSAPNRISVWMPYTTVMYRMVGKPTLSSLGVMNIMLVSVTERTHKIGVRMAVGARRSDIMQQFMIEAVLVCLIGGALGIALSFAAGSLFTALAGGMLTAIYSWQAAVVAFCCSTLIGMIFGYLPARKAARMDPVNSLASE